MGDVITLVVNMNKKGFERGCTELRGAINSLSKAAGKMAGGLKSVIPSIIGVGSAFGILTKAASTFMSQNLALTRQMEAVWTALGNLLGPIIERLVSWVVQAVSYLISFLNLLGITSKSASELSKKAQGATAGLQKTIAGFDELNVLQDNGQGSLPNLEPKEWMSELADLLKNHQFAEAGRYLAAKLNEMIENIDWEGLGKKLAFCFKGAVDFLGNFIRDFDAHRLGELVATMFNQILNIDTEGENTWKNLAEILVAKFTLVFDFLTGFLEELDMGALARAISEIFIGVLEALSDSIATADWKKIGENIGNFFANIDWEGIAEAIWKAFTTALAGASDLYEGLPDWLQDIALGLVAIKTASAGITFFNSLATSIQAIKNLEAVGMFGKIGEVIAIVASGAGTLNEAMTLVFGTIGTAVAGIGSIIAGAFTAVTNFFDMLKNGFSWLKEILMVIGIALAAVGAVILGAPALITAVIAAIIAAVATAVVVIKDNWQAIREWFGETCSAICQFFSDLWSDVVAVAQDTWSSILEFATTCVETVQNAWGGIVEWFGGISSAISQFFSDLWTTVTELVQVGIEMVLASVTICITTIVTMGSNAIAAIRNGWAAMQQWLSNICTSIGQFFADLWNGVVTIAQTTWDNVGSIVTNCIQGLTSGWSNFRTFILGLWNGIVSGVKSAINSIIGCVNGMIAGVVSGVNAVSNVLNRIRIDIPSWVPGIGGATLGFSMPTFSAPQIPYLEKGGVLKKGQVGILEGKGGEAVVPLERNTEWINKMADAFMARVQSGNYDLTGNAKVMAALNSIADRVSYHTPTIAKGTVVPYGVDTPPTPTNLPESDSELIALFEELGEKLDQILYLMEHLQFVADFGDNIRALARKITKEQRREQIAEGR